ncbi:MAG TPA: hypothetical protein ENJ01_04305 [Gammaproteobacteria bacterium]|nr:hypothetical protein [Gammaproteobacteria bacterium]
MKNNIKPIAQNPQPDTTAPRIAEVAEAENGEALTLLLGGEEFPVIAHADGVPPLQVGDRVVFLATDDGVIVTHRLRAPGEHPTRGFSVRPDGSLIIDAGEGITLATDHATIQLRADGRIMVDGREIYSVARGLQRLQGATIALN